MKLQQLSVFLENKPGQLSLPCHALGKAKINILSLSLADTQQFGILRLIVADPAAAKQALEKAGCVVKLTEVVAIHVIDAPDGLAKVLKIIEKAGVNIEYMYPLNVRRGKDAALVFRFDDPEAAIKLLASKGYNVVGAADLQ